MRTHRRRRGDDPDPPVAARQRRGRGTWPDDAEDRQLVAAPQVRQRDGRRGVAGDHDRLDVTGDERLDRFAREREHLVVGPRAVRRPGVVAQVDRRFAGQPPDDLAKDRQTADT